MKLTLYPLLALVLVSCGGSSEIDITGFSNTDGSEAVARNFSKAKYNENILEKFVFPEMKTVLTSLESIKTKTSNCKADFAVASVQNEWKSATFAYQRIRPIEISLLDRDPETSLKLSERYLGGPYSASLCDIQLNTAEQSLFSSNLIDDPALNSLEILIYGNLTTQNNCAGANAEKVTAWFSTDEKSADICRHINFISKTALKQLNEINTANMRLFKNGQIEEILTNNTTQALYDNIAVFIDQILKDDKIGQPLGQSEKCPFAGKTCPTAVEHRLSNVTFETLSKNLEGVMAVYNGKTSMGKPQADGLYQFLIANQKDEVAVKFYKNIIEAHALSTSLEGQSLVKIAEALDGAENKEKCNNASTNSADVPACALFRSIKNLSDKVKTDLRLALAVSSTKQIEGDSD